VLVRVHAFGLNRMDLSQRQGRYAPPAGASGVLGVEFSGVVAAAPAPAPAPSSPTAAQRAREALAPRRPFRVGDEVFGLAPGGAYAEYVRAPVAGLLHKPAGLTHARAAALPEAWFTAAQAALLVGRLPRGGTALWHAGASGVSGAGLQICRVAGGASKVFATARRDDKIRWLKEEAGCAEAWHAEADDWVAGVLEATGGRGVDLVVDYVGGPTFERNLRALAVDGCVVMLALLGGARTEGAVDVSLLLRKRARVEGSTLRNRGGAYHAKLRDMLEEMLPRFDDGTYKIHIEREMDWGRIVEAHELMESNATKGKIICTIPQD
jgi:NADPH:quinone reductase-like Zn-dependent oxidoreductase